MAGADDGQRVDDGAQVLQAEAEIAVDPVATNHPLSVWSRGEHAFVVPAGDYTVDIGTSSEDTPFQTTFTVAG